MDDLKLVLNEMLALDVVVKDRVLLALLREKIRLVKSVR